MCCEFVRVWVSETETCSYLTKICSCLIKHMHFLFTQHRVNKAGRSQRVSLLLLASFPDMIFCFAVKNITDIIFIQTELEFRQTAICKIYGGDSTPCNRRHLLNEPTSSLAEFKTQSVWVQTDRRFKPWLWDIFYGQRSYYIAVLSRVRPVAKAKWFHRFFPLFTLILFPHKFGQH